MQLEPFFTSFIFNDAPVKFIGENSVEVAGLSYCCILVYIGLQVASQVSCEIQLSFGLGV